MKNEKIGVGYFEKQVQSEWQCKFWFYCNVYGIVTICR
jgi:hypothetical protein